MHNSLNILIVNPVHPNAPHISAVRAWNFAKELAQLKHRVVLLTVRSPKNVNEYHCIEKHNWSLPYLVEVDNGKPPEIKLPAFLSKVNTALQLVSAGGKRWRWVMNAPMELQRISANFVPDIIWCTFGLMEAVVVARRISKKILCPWVLDIKDNWELYVPFGLRRIMVIRTSGAAAITSNAVFTAEKVLKWQHRRASVIYSGVDDSFFNKNIVPENLNYYTINLIGSLYNKYHLAILLQGIHLWSENLACQSCQKISLRYLGGDIAMFNEAAIRWVPDLKVEALGYVSISHMAEMCKTAMVNAYVGNPNTFHHKLLELLACDKPILVCPFESQESHKLASLVQGNLLEAKSPAEVAERLEGIRLSWSTRANPLTRATMMRQYTWPTQAKHLERILLDIAKELR